MKENGCLACNEGQPASVDNVSSIIRSVDTYASENKISYYYMLLLQEGVLHEVHSEVVRQLKNGESLMNVVSYVEGRISEAVSTIINPHKTVNKATNADVEDTISSVSNEINEYDYWDSPSLDDLYNGW